MKNIILLFLVLTSCSQAVKQELQLDGPTIEDAELHNVNTGDYLDGIYKSTTIQTQFSYSPEYEKDKTYFLAYKPVIVPRDFKLLRRDESAMGTPVITVELQNNAHKNWFLATEEAFQNQKPLFIVLDGKVVSAPVLINGPISGGKLQISGNFTKDGVDNMIQGILERNSSIKK